MKAPLLRARVLVIDDDTDYVASLKGHLETSFEAVDCAAGEAQAWALLEENSYDLILMELILDYDAAGLGMCRRLKGAARWRDVPILVVTDADTRYGLNLKSYLGDRQCMPADDFVDKNVAAKEVVKRARRIVERPA